MGTYQVEQLIIEQNTAWSDLRKYVENEAFQQQAHEIEENLFRKLLEIGKVLLKEVFTRFGTGKSGTAIVNESGEKLPCHKIASRRYLSIFGSIDVERACYWKQGSAVIAPFDAHFNLPKRQYSHLLEKWTQDGIAEEPYEEAIQRIENIFGIDLCKREQEILSQEIAEETKLFYKEQPHVRDIPEGSLIVATTDCKGVVMVPRERSEQAQCKMRDISKARDGRGRKGLKRDAVVTADYSINPEARTPEEVLELLMRTDTKEQHKEKKKEQKARRLRGIPKPRESINKQVTASLEGKTAAFEDLADRIAQRDPSGLKKIFLQVDGAKSLEKGLFQVFEKRGWLNRIEGVALDIIHVMEYVWEVSTSLYGEKSEDRVYWVRKQGLAILQGKVGYVIGGLRQILKKRKKLRSVQKNVLEKTITYFDNHKHMMKYDEYLAKGFPIATGIIEGACGSLVKDRVERSGMKWTRRGAQAVLNLRALKRNGDWETYWDFYLKREHKRLYSKGMELQAA